MKSPVSDLLMEEKTRVVTSILPSLDSDTTRQSPRGFMIVYFNALETVELDHNFSALTTTTASFYAAPNFRKFDTAAQKTTLSARKKKGAVSLGTYTR